MEIYIQFHNKENAIRHNFTTIW